MNFSSELFRRSIRENKKVIDKIYNDMIRKSNFVNQQKMMFRKLKKLPKQNTYHHKTNMKNRVMNRQNYNHGKRGIGSWSK